MDAAEKKPLLPPWAVKALIWCGPTLFFLLVDTAIFGLVPEKETVAPSLGQQAVWEWPLKGIPWFRLVGEGLDPPASLPPRGGRLCRSFALDKLSPGFIMSI